MSYSTRVTLLVFGGAAAITLGIPGLAAAEESATPQAHGAPRADRLGEESQDFAGYVGALDDLKTAVATFTAPPLDCGAEDKGIDTLVELASAGGAEFVDGALFSYCLDGEPHYVPGFDVFTETEGDVGVTIDELVVAGDKIKVSSKLKGDKIKVTYTNKTQDWEAKDSFAGLDPTEGSVLQYAMFVGEGDVLPPLDENSKVTDAKIGGQDLKDADTTKYTFVDVDGNPVIKATKIKKGTDFTFKYVG